MRGEQITKEDFRRFKAIVRLSDVKIGQALGLKRRQVVALMNGESPGSARVRQAVADVLDGRARVIHDGKGYTIIWRDETSRPDTVLADAKRLQTDHLRALIQSLAEEISARGDDGLDLAAVLGEHSDMFKIDMSRGRRGAATALVALAKITGLALCIWAEAVYVARIVDDPRLLWSALAFTAIVGVYGAVEGD